MNDQGLSNDYSAYLMRVWRNEDTGEPRIVLENAHTGERVGFASLQMLLTYLRNSPLQPQTSNQSQIFRQSDPEAKGAG